MSVADKLRALVAHDATSAPDAPKLRLRADIPMPMPGKKVNRKDLVKKNPSVLEEENVAVERDDKISDDALRQEMSAVKEPSLTILAPRTLCGSSCSGAQVQRQLDSFRSLLTLRIQLEQPLKAAHRIQQDNTGSCADLRDKAEKLLDSLLELQGRSRGPAAAELALGSRKRKREETWIDLEERNDRVFSWALGLFDDIKEKTKLEARKGFKVLEQSLSQQVNATLASDEWRRRCHPALSTEETADGSKEGYDPTIYDDRDFYTSLLKDIVQGKDAVVMRQTQKRKCVERRASKGRKIRFVPITKLQNFMAPHTLHGERETHMDQIIGSLFR